MKAYLISGILNVLLLGGASSTASASGWDDAAKKVELAMLVTGSVDIEADGSVSAHQLDQLEKLPEGVKRLIAGAVPTWRFEPVIVDGEPKAARTSMAIRVVSKVAENDQVIVHLAGASFSGGSPEEYVSVKRQPAPQYPPYAYFNGVSGTVYLVLRIGRDGKPQQVVAERVNMKVLDSEPGLQKWRNLLAQTAITGARSWRYIPPTRGPEIDEPYWSIRVPVDFIANRKVQKQYGEWEVYVPGPIRRIPWGVEHDDRSGGDAYLSGTTYPVGAGPRLLTPLSDS